MRMAASESHVQFARIAPKRNKLKKKQYLPGINDDIFAI